MTDTTDAAYGVLTDESFERSRTRIGVPQVLPNMPHNLEVSRTGCVTSRTATATTTPCTATTDYATGTRWGGLDRSADVPLHDGRGRLAAAGSAREQGAPEGRSVRRARFVPGGDGVRMVAAAARSATG